MLNKFISTEEAARRSGHHPAYLENLCGAGKIDAVLLGNIWLVSPVSFSSFLAESDAKKAAIARMAQEPHRGNCCSAMKSPPAFQNVFQAQAFSALVAISVLLGGLFAAHSEFLEQVVVHAGNEALSFVYDTRAAVLSLSEDASNREFAFHTQDLPESSGQLTATSYIANKPLFASFLDAFAPTVTEPVEESAEYELFSNGPKERLSKNISALISIDTLCVQQAVGDTALFVGVQLRDVSSGIFKGSKALAHTWRHFSYSTLSLYESGIQKWVRGSYVVSEKMVTATYVVGDTLSTFILRGIPEARSMYSLAIENWGATSLDIARTTSTFQVGVGNRLISLAKDLRVSSKENQRLVGSKIVNVATSAHHEWGRLSTGIVAPLTASVGASVLGVETPPSP